MHSHVLRIQSPRQHQDLYWAMRIPNLRARLEETRQSIEDGLAASAMNAFQGGRMSSWLLSYWDIVSMLMIFDPSWSSFHGVKCCCTNKNNINNKHKDLTSIYTNRSQFIQSRGHQMKASAWRLEAWEVSYLWLLGLTRGNQWLKVREQQIF